MFNKYGTLLLITSFTVITTAERQSLGKLGGNIVTMQDVFHDDEYFAKRELYSLKRRNDKLALSVELKMTRDRQWVAPIRLLSSFQPYKVVVDTGATRSWFASRHGWESHEHTKSGMCSRHPEKGPFDAECVYASGDPAIRGDWYKDDVSITGMTSLGQNKIQALGLFFGGISVKRWRRSVLAMAHSSGNQDEPTFIQAIKSSLILPIFALYLGEKNPKLYLGGTNPLLYTGKIEYYEVVDEKYWILGDTELFINSEEGPVVDKFKVMINSGAPFIYGPQANVEEIYKKIGPLESYNTGGWTTWNGQYLIPCNKVPMISFSWNGGETKWEVSSDMFNIGQRGNTAKCIGALVAYDLEHEPGLWMLGGVFLKTVLAEFHLEPLQIGFAKLRQRT